MNYYERHIGDYLKDTSHLSLLEHGVYTRLLDVYYTREAAIPDCEVMRLVGARSKEEKAAVTAVLREFFRQEESGDWVQMRCEREIDRFQDKQRKAKASAEARWGAQRPQSDGNANAYADGMRTHSDGNANGMHRAPVPSPQSPSTKEIPPNPPRGEGRFTEFWASWPNTDRKQDRKKCLTKWRRCLWDSEADAILAHVTAMKATRKWLDGFEPAPLTYLNGERWRDGVVADRSAADIFAGAR